FRETRAKATLDIVKVFSILSRHASDLSFLFCAWDEQVSVNAETNHAASNAHGSSHELTNVFAAADHISDAGIPVVLSWMQSEVDVGPVQGNHHALVLSVAGIHNCIETSLWNH